MKNAKVFDLEEITTVFAGNLIIFCKRVQFNLISNVLLKQVLRSGTSIGANYREADDASSKKDFIYKISLCRKEARETNYWLRLLRQVCVVCEDLLVLEREFKELNLIFSKIFNSAKGKKD